MYLALFSLLLTPAASSQAETSKQVKLHRVSEVVVGAQGPERERDDRPVMGVALVESDEGAVIRAVIEGSPAEEAGIQAGDQVVKVGKKKVTDNESLIGAIQSHEVGDSVKVRVMRGEERHDMKVRLASAEELSSDGGGREVQELRIVQEGDDGDRWLVSPGEDHPRSLEDVNYWESEDGSERHLEIHIEGDEVPHDRIREILREHGLEVDELHFGGGPGEHDIDIHIDHQRGGEPRGPRRRDQELSRRMGEGDHGWRGDRRVFEGDKDHRGGRADERQGRNRWSENDDRGRERGQRGDGRDRARDGRRDIGNRARGENRGDRGRRGGRRNDRGRNAEAEGMNQGWRGQRGDRGWGRERDNGWGEGVRRERDDRPREGMRRGGQGPQSPREMRERGGRGERPEQDRGRQDGRGEHRDEGSDHHEMDIHEEIQHLHEERGRRQEELQQHGEEIMRGVEDAHSDLEEQVSERRRFLEGERERVLHELNQQIEEVSRRFDEAFQDVEAGFEERSRRIEEESERRSEELRVRGEEMERRFDERIHELEERAEQSND